MKKILNTSMIYFILAAAAGVFYREFTKFNGYTGETALSYVHTHLFCAWNVCVSYYSFVWLSEAGVI